MKLCYISYQFACQQREEILFRPRNPQRLRKIGTIRSTLKKLPDFLHFHYFTG